MQILYAVAICLAAGPTSAETIIVWHKTYEITHQAEKKKKCNYSPGTYETSTGLHEHYTTTEHREINFSAIFCCTCISAHQGTTE